MQRSLVPLVVAVTLGSALTPAAAAAQAPAAARADVNGDGVADLVISTGARLTYSGDTYLTPHDLGGSVQVVPGGTVLPGAPAALVNQNTAGVGSGMEADDRFGAALATGDFNGDGYADLGVGAPGEAIETKARAGGAWVFYGGGGGLTTRTVAGFHQDDPDLAGAAEAGDLMGWALAAGDVTGDHRDDLAVLSAGEVITGTTGARGSVHLLHGSANGLAATASSYVSVGAAATAGKWRSVVIGKFHGGANADLVVQADHRRGGPASSGALVAVRGARTGLTGSVQVIDQDTPSVPGGTEAGDHFGGALAVGDLDGDHVDDLAAGAIKENTRAGSVFLFRGSPNGLLATAPTAFGQNAATINGDEQPGEGFGYGLRILDLTGDGTPALVVATPWEGGSTQTGALFLLTIRLSGDALAVTGSRRLTRAEIGTPSGFGPGAPIAGGAHVLNDNLD